MKSTAFLWILVWAAVSESLLQELYRDYCFERQANVEALFKPLETFPRILAKAKGMLDATEGELVMYSHFVFATIWSRINVNKGSLVHLLLYYESINSYGVDSIRKLYFDQLRNIHLVKQTALKQANTVFLVHSAGLGFHRYHILRQETLAQIDSLARASTQDVFNRYIKLLSELDAIRHDGELFLIKHHTQIRNKTL
ncbi:hypothetical protein DSO57_1001086 [Entomophthora muscae]|uniref:Uncharacterized protein n=1 Tax=Entomophthora muscae TaxID=34485 RepID=A0ACC2SB69_9FUNG|nr:hypothetical protein DSO57_1001086 [Entomophthora muscae]